MTQELREAPPPRRHETHGNLKRRTKKVSTNGPGRPSKGLQQMNLKLEPETHARLTELFERHKNDTRSDVIKTVLATYQKHGGQPIPESRPAPLAADHAENRTAAETLFFNPRLLEILRDISRKQQRTMSDLVQNLIDRGRRHAELEREVGNLQNEIDALRAQIGKDKAA